MKLMIILMSGLLGLSGCATFNDLSRTSADELLPRPTAQVLHADLGAAEGFDCAKLPKAWPKTTPSDVQLFERARYCAMIEDDTSLVDRGNDTSLLDGGSSTPVTSVPRKHLPRFVRHGMELADAHCEVFLDAMEGKRVLTEFNLSNFNILVGAATVAMAKLGNHPQSLFNLATGATAANAFADNYKANFLLTGTMYQLRLAVKDFREEMVKKSDLATPEKYASYTAAQGDLREYASVCSHKGLVHLVNTKLADTKFEATNLDRTAGDRLVGMLLAEAKARDETITKTGFSAGEFEVVYELARLEKATRVALMTKLVANDKKLLKEKFPGVWPVLLALELNKDSPRAIADILLAGKLLGYPLGTSETQRAQIAELIKPPVVPSSPPTTGSPAAAPVAQNAPVKSGDRKSARSVFNAIRGVEK